MAHINKNEFDKDLETIASEIEGFLLSRNVKAIAAVICTADGMIHTRMRYIPDGKIPLVAACALLQRDVLEYIKD